MANKSKNGHDAECLCLECVIVEQDGKGGNGYKCETCDVVFRDDDAYYKYAPILCIQCSLLRRQIHT